MREISNNENRKKEGLMEEKLRILKIRKARLWSEIESLATVSDLMFTNFGKTEAEIMKLELLINSKQTNDLDDNH